MFVTKKTYKQELDAVHASAGTAWQAWANENEKANKLRARVADLEKQLEESRSLAARAWDAWHSQWELAGRQAIEIEALQNEVEHLREENIKAARDYAELRRCNETAAQDYGQLVVELQAKIDAMEAKQTEVFAAYSQLGAKLDELSEIE